jgi:hypothetical protein
MDANVTIIPKIVDAIKSLEKVYPAGKESITLTDILLQVNPETGELVIMNDDDEVLSRCIVEEWIGDKDDNFYDTIVPLLRSCLEQQSELLEHLSILKPYSIVLVDEDKETLTDLHIVDDDTVIVGDELLKGLDEELDEFINNLMKE